MLTLSLNNYRQGRTSVDKDGIILGVIKNACIFNTDLGFFEFQVIEITADRPIF